MVDSIVTARVPQEKKEAVGAILKQLGSSPSQVINQLYDYVLEHKELPLMATRPKGYTAEDINDALALLGSISISPDSRFNDMSYDEIMAERAATMEERGCE